MVRLPQAIDGPEAFRPQKLVVSLPMHEEGMTAVLLECRD
jgi:hypothetical protein